jgi:hypothetical protein
MSQNTVGTISYNEEESFEGYNLIYPHNQSTVFLINSCGEVVHSWTDEDEFRPGNTAYILENGNLVKTKRGNSPINDPIWAGGGGETVEVRDWNNNLISSFDLNDEKARLHHDIAITENGNILMIAWELKTLEEALSSGRNPDLLASNVLWSEMILEWDPSSDEIVWEWHAWDHLIQDFDSTRSNFGTVSDHPELIDINYDEHDGHQDWLHINSIDYNPVLDQIVMSVPYFNELWIIDHSTSTMEASSSTGGDSGKGGNLIYRWGNPAAYQMGSLENKELFFQHDVKWVDPNASSDSNDFGLLSLYNNRVDERFSSIHTLQTDYDPISGSYSFIDGIFAPIDFEVSVIHPDTSSFAVSSGLSSAQFLPNGNTLTLSGRWGYAFELNAINELVWEYRVPLRGGSPIEQGTELSINNNITFRIDRYPLDFPGFNGRELVPGNRLELNPNAVVCDVISNTNEEDLLDYELKILGNPSREFLDIMIEKDDFIEIFDATGGDVKRIKITSGYNTIDINEFSSGLLFIRTSVGKVFKHVLVK